MKKILLILSVLFLFTACSIFKQNSKAIEYKSPCACNYDIEVITQKG